MMCSNPINQVMNFIHYASRKPVPLVPSSHQNQQCPRSRVRRIYLERSAQNRAVAEAFRRLQQAAQGGAVCVGDVDIEFLHQPGGEAFIGAAARGAGENQG